MRTSTRTAWKTVWLLRLYSLSVLLACSCVSMGPRSTWKVYGSDLSAKATVIDKKTTNWQLWIGSPTNRQMVTELYSEEGIVWTCLPSIRTGNIQVMVHARSQMVKGGGGQGSVVPLWLSQKGLAAHDKEDDAGIPWEGLPEIVRRAKMRDNDAMIWLHLRMPVFMDDIERFCSVLGRSGIVGLRVMVVLEPDVEWLEQKRDRPN
jgi:hypothetical protein